MNEGHEFGFFIVLLAVILGLYVAFTGFMSSREAQRVLPTSPAATSAVQATRPPTELVPAATATLLIIPTPLPGLTATLTALIPTGPVESPPGRSNRRRRQGQPRRRDGAPHRRALSRAVAH